MKIEFTKAAGPFNTQEVLLNGKRVGLIRKQGRFYILSAKDGSTMETQGMKKSYAKSFRFRSDAQNYAKTHWS